MPPGEDRDQGHGQHAYKNLVKFGRAIFKSCERKTDRQANRQTSTTLITIRHTRRQWPRARDRDETLIGLYVSRDVEDPDQNPGSKVRILLFGSICLQS